MADQPERPHPHLTGRALDAKRAREQRQADALRANLRRRKEQNAPPAADATKDDTADG